MKRERIIDYLSNLSESELTQLVYESTQSKREEKRYENGDFEITDVFILATCSFGVYKGKTDDKAIVEVYAPPYDGNITDIGGPITLQGECPLCKTSLISYVKRVACPICKTETYLT